MDHDYRPEARILGAAFEQGMSILGKHIENGLKAMAETMRQPPVEPPAPAQESPLCSVCGEPDQEEGRWCPDCYKYKPTCRNDHCLECGVST